MRQKQQEYILKFRDIEINIVSKSMKTMRLTVYPPDGRVRLALPWGVSQEKALTFLNSKWDWIQQQRTVFLHEAERRKQYEELFSYFGHHFSKQVVFLDAKPKIYIVLNELTKDDFQFNDSNYGLNELSTQFSHSEHQANSHDTHNRTPLGYLQIQVRPGTSIENQDKLLKNWCRTTLYSFLTPLIFKWQDIIGVYSNFYGIKSMKTRWGSCNVTNKRIWLNLELIKLPISCLEYVVVHELLHLVEPSHNHRFKSLLTHYCPTWLEQKALLKKRLLI